MIALVLWWLVKVAVVGLIAWLVLYAIRYFEIPEPFNKVMRAIVALLAVAFLIYMLFRLFASLGHPIQ